MDQYLDEKDRAKALALLDRASLLVDTFPEDDPG
jgi:hypothetical protein